MYVFTKFSEQEKLLASPVVVSAVTLRVEIARKAKNAVTINNATNNFLEYLFNIKHWEQFEQIQRDCNTRMIFCQQVIKIFSKLLL